MSDFGLGQPKTTPAPSTLPAPPPGELSDLVAVIATVDRKLAEIGKRSLVSTQEVTDLLLDVRYTLDMLLTAERLRELREAEAL